MKQSSFFLSFLHPVFATLAFENPLLFVWYLKHPAQLSDALMVRLVKKNQTVSDEQHKIFSSGCHREQGEQETQGKLQIDIP